MLKCFHGWIPSTIHLKLFKKTLADAYNIFHMQGVNEEQVSHFFIEGFRAAREIAEAANSTSTNTSSPKLPELEEVVRQCGNYDPDESPTEYSLDYSSIKRVYTFMVGKIGK